MRFIQKFALSLLALGTGQTLASNVIEATQDNFDSVVLNSGIPTILDIYASWCGHCKKLSPVWDQLADAFKDKPVQVVKIDGDIHREVSSKFDVKSFPTLKYINAQGEVEAVNVPRTLEDLASFVAKKTGVPSGIAPKKKSAVVQLTDDIFDKIAYDASKTVIVAFTAQWCAHCKSLKPQYEKTADIYRYEQESIVLAEVDTSSPGTTELVERFEIQSFPTILIFPDEENLTEPVVYSGGRETKDFVEAINAAVGLDRQLDGSLGTSAGRFRELDELSQKYLNATPEEKKEMDGLFEQFVTQGKGEERSSALLYQRYAKKVSLDGAQYIKKEAKRLASILAKKSLGRVKLEDMQRKFNILNTFAGRDEDDEATAESVDTSGDAERDEL